MSKLKRWWEGYSSALNNLTNDDENFLSNYTEDEFLKIFQARDDDDLLRIVLNTSKITLHEGVKMLERHLTFGDWVAPDRDAKMKLKVLNLPDQIIKEDITYDLIEVNADSDKIEAKYLAPGQIKKVEIKGIFTDD